MKELTNRQKEVLAFIRDYIKKQSYPPTMREIAERFAISTKGAYDHVKALEKKGVISCDSKRSRAIEITNGDEVKFIPLLITVSSGLPLFNEKNYEKYLPIAADWLKAGNNYFAFKVPDESMLNAQINKDDIALFCEQESAEDGDIVLAVVDDAVTLRQVFMEGSRIKLQAENINIKAIYTTNSYIIGKLAAIIRTY
ncbi:MAG: transcriptional repressor LexA [Spirochaetaceae bacterium]|nr:transcriptional repressor LexA [Spirochaetaceae bacterium]